MLKYFDGIKWNIKLILYILIGMVSGLLLVHLAGDSFIQENHRIWEERILLLQTLNIEHAELFRSIFGKRMFFLIALFIIGFTKFGRSLLCIGTVWFGLSCSSLCSLFLQMEGMKGLLLFLTFIFPHIFIYFFVYVFYFFNIYTMSERVGNNGVQRIQLLQWNKHMYVRYFISFVIMFVLVLFGILVEVWCNPVLLKKIATFF